MRDPRSSHSFSFHYRVREEVPSCTCAPMRRSRADTRVSFSIFSIFVLVSVSNALHGVLSSQNETVLGSPRKCVDSPSMVRSMCSPTCPNFVFAVALRWARRSFLPRIIVPLHSVCRSSSNVSVPAICPLILRVGHLRVGIQPYSRSSCSPPSRRFPLVKPPGRMEGTLCLTPKPMVRRFRTLPGDCLRSRPIQ